MMIARVVMMRWIHRHQLQLELLTACFRCPITMEILVDPVLVVESGHTYERSEIEKWFHTHSTDPVTNHTLKSKRVVPNFSMRHTIEAQPGKILPVRNEAFRQNPVTEDDFAETIVTVWENDRSLMTRMQASLRSLVARDSWPRRILNTCRVVEAMFVIANVALISTATFD